MANMTNKQEELAKAIFNTLKIDVNEFNKGFVQDVVKKINPNDYRAFYADLFGEDKRYLSGLDRIKEVSKKFIKKNVLWLLETNQWNFNNVDEVKIFCDTYFRGCDLCYGAGSFFDYVIIGMDKDGVLINKYFQNNGFFQKLTSEKESEVYEWLFKNQNRIGVVKVVPYYETDLKYQLGYDFVDDEISNNVKGLLDATTN